MDDTSYGHTRLYKSGLAPLFMHVTTYPVHTPSLSYLMPTARALSMVRRCPRLTTWPYVLDARTLGAPVLDPKSYLNTLYTDALFESYDLGTQLLRLFQQRSMNKPKIIIKI